MSRKSNSWIKWILITILITIIYVFFGQMKYLEPEDYVFTGTVAGISGENDLQYFLHPYFSVFLGYILGIAANATGIFNFYAIFILSMYTLVFIGMHYLAAKCENTRLIHLAVIVFQLLLARYLTYTSLSYLGIGVFVLYVYIRSDRKKFLVDVFFLLLAIIGILMRGEVLFTTILMLFPCILKPIFEERKYKFFAIGCALAITLIGIGSSYCNQIAYRADDIWNSYYDWNAASTNVRDFAAIDYEKYAGIFHEVGWSPNDLNLVNSWKYIDLNTFNEENLITVAKAVSLSDRYELNVFHIVFGMIRQKTSLVLLACSLLFLLSQKKPKGILDWIWNLTVYIAPIGLMGALFLRQRYVERIAVPILILGLLQMFILNKAGTLQRDKLLRFMSIICCLCLVFIAEIRFVKTADENKHQELSNYIASTEDILYVTNSGLANELICADAIIDIDESNYYPNVLKLGSWDSYSKRYYNQIHKYNVEDPDNMLHALAVEENVRLLTQFPEDCEALQKYLNEHYNLEGQFVIECIFDDSSVIYHWQEDMTSLRK